LKKGGPAGAGPSQNGLKKGGPAGAEPSQNGLKKGGPAGAEPSRKDLEDLEEFDDFAVEASAEGETDGKRFGLGRNREIGDRLRFDGASGDGFREIGGGVGGTEGEMDDGSVGRAIRSSVGEEFEEVIVADADHASTGVAFAPSAAELATDGGVEGDGFVDVFALDGDVMETLQHGGLLGVKSKRTIFWDIWDI
jgi:hypothetical protein